MLNFNKFKKGNNIMYTTLTTFDKLINELTKQQVPTSMRTYGTFEVDVLDDGKQQVTINTIGHNPKDITVDVTDEEVIIKATKGEGTSRFVKDIDLMLSVGKDYDGTKTEAKFENGLLVLTIDKKVNKKAKSLKISY